MNNPYSLIGIANKLYSSIIKIGQYIFQVLKSRTESVNSHPKP